MLKSNKPKKKSLLAQLGPAAQAQVKAQIGEKRFKKLLGGQDSKQGRIRVSPKEDRTVDGIVFASKWEMTTYQALVKEFGKEAVELQPEFELQPGFTDVTGKKHRPINYLADFRVNGHVCDSKGMRTDIFRMKVKQFLYIYKQPLWELKNLKDIQSFIEAAKSAFNHAQTNNTADQGDRGSGRGRK